MEETKFKALIVWLIANGKTEEALEKLAKHYNVETPQLKVGLPKGHKTKAFGCYSQKNHMISVLNSDSLKNPFVILHEFYHHTRIGVDTKHKGTEKYADTFAIEFMRAYRIIILQNSGNN